jgi:carboxyl-terminal processing protease
MPRRNLLVIMTVALLSFICYKSVTRDRYARYFEQNWNYITSNFLDAEKLDREALFQAAMQGMMDKLDENSTYIGPEFSTRLQEDLQGNFGGIGVVVELDQRTNQLIVLSPIAGTPAYEMGLLAGDHIAAVDGRSTDGLGMEEVVSRIKGRPGTAVKLTINRQGQKDPVELEIKRATIQVDSVLGDVRKGDNTWDFFLDEHPDIGYVRLSSFGEHTAEELETALARLEAKGMKGLILDLRNNPGGLLSMAVDTCDLFIDKHKFDGEIVRTAGHDPRDERKFTATGGGPYQTVPMVILINKYSASASEIVAACLQDHGRAVVIGERSYGKGTVQNVIEAEGGRSKLKLTTATYRRPSGKNIHRSHDASESDEWGVKPNPGFEVATSDDDLRAWYRQRRHRDQWRTNGQADPKPASAKSDKFVDRPLDKAVEYLETKLAAKAE